MVVEGSLQIHGVCEAVPSGLHTVDSVRRERAVLLSSLNWTLHQVAHLLDIESDDVTEYACYFIRYCLTKPDHVSTRLDEYNVRLFQVASTCRVASPRFAYPVDFSSAFRLSFK